MIDNEQSPSPWWVQSYGDWFEVVADDGRPVATDINSFKDACLIASAPASYAALSKFVDSFGDPFKDALLALEKAEGK